jgi:hypothetical protein
MLSGKAFFPMLCAASALLAQACVVYLPAPEYSAPPYPPPSPPAANPPQPEAGQPPAPPAQPPSVSPLDAIVAPIALYPDPLLALILPASTSPSDISAAAAYLIQYGDMTQIDSQPWDPSVRALAHYPTVISWMSANMAWTQALGSAFAASPADVMDAAQRLRARAIAAGTLLSTSQQRVADDDGQIEILPAQPDSLYVPVYDTDVVYSDEPYYGYAGPFMNFGDPCPEGIWLSYSFDWHRHRVWEGGRGLWEPNSGWIPPRLDGNHGPPGAHSWAPRSPVAPPGVGPGVRPPIPRPMPGSPNPPPEHYKKRPSAEPQGQAHVSSPQAAPGRTAPAATPMERPRLAPETVYTGAEHPAAPASGQYAAPAGQEAPAPGSYARGPAKPQAAPAHAAPQKAPAPQPAPAPDAKGNPPEK